MEKGDGKKRGRRKRRKRTREQEVRGRRKRRDEKGGNGGRVDTHPLPTYPYAPLPTLAHPDLESAMVGFDSTPTPTLTPTPTPTR